MCMEDDDADEKPNICFLCAGPTGLEDMVEQWQQFDANACRCFEERDKARIFSIVSAYPGGVESFNDHVKRIAAQLIESASAVHPALGTFSAGPPLAMSD